MDIITPPNLNLTEDKDLTDAVIKIQANVRRVKALKEAQRLKDEALRWSLYRESKLDLCGLSFIVQFHSNQERN